LARIALARASSFPASRDTSIELSSLGAWAADEFQARDLLTIVAFVAQVRTPSAKIWNYRSDAIRNQLNAIGLSTHSGLLESDDHK